MKNIEYILNDCLNKAMCQKNRIQKPNSNNIADFVSKYLQTEKLTLTDVGCSLKILCKDLNLDPESVLLEYCNIENGFEVYYDEGIVETYLVKKGFIQL